MTQALFTSMTGLNAGTEQLTVVSDNVANMNTTAYKTSRVDFQDIWYATRTTGTNSTAVMGGTNPYQVGVGVKCSAITKDFGVSSTNTTGRPEDMAITGEGWFTVINSDGKVLLTRDGSFSLDENGFLCTANGYKLLGMNNQEALTASTTPVRIPHAIKVNERGTETDLLEDMESTELNGLGSVYGGVGITSGAFIVEVEKDGTTTPITVDLGNTKAKNMKEILAAINNGSQGAFTASFKDGTMVIKPTDSDARLNFKNVDGGSNFVNATGIGSSAKVAGEYATRVLNYSASIGLVDNLTSDTTMLYSEFSVGQDGLITVTYGDGSKLSAKANPDGSMIFTYQDASGVIIDGDTANSTESSLYVDPNLLEISNMQIQLAKVVNNGGLVAEGNNTYSVGVNCGDVVYTTGNHNGCGAIQSGALETSNVDLAQQFSNMILAQRLVQANSQVFSGANSMLETLVYLGGR